MKFLIITHVPHLIHEDKYYAYAPYVNEMNLWGKYADNVIIAAPRDFSTAITPIQTDYQHDNITFIKLKSFDILSFRSLLASFLRIPFICIAIFRAMRQADHIHLRCPGNIGLLGCIVQVFFPSKIKTAKYAGNWDPESTQPFTYRLQRKILSSTLLTRNMQVLVYGEWPGSTKNIKPFFTATYSASELQQLPDKNPSGTIKMVFAGGLVKGKNPLYAIKLLELLRKHGTPATLDLYGDGNLYEPLQQYIIQNKLQDCVVLHGNQNKQVLKEAYQQAHFAILPSDSEGWPKAVAEGMFWGCVPIATAVSCLPYMLDHGNRGVLLTMDPAQDAKAILQLMRDHEDFKRKSNAAAAWSRQFTLDVFEKEIKKLMHR